MIARTDRRWEALAVVSILLVAAAFRLLAIQVLPPGLYQDEAVNGVNAQTILAGMPRIYYGEREPLYMYLAAIGTLLLGPTPLALRVTSAFTGILGVAAGGAFARQLFGRRIGLITAAGLASSLWLTTLSRIGFRAITLPMVECLGLALLWRSTYTGRTRDYALSGAVLGLTLYTYLSARFLPIALFAFVLVTGILHRDWLRKQIRGLIVAGIAAFVVCIPLGLYAHRHPEMLLGRPDQVALPGGAAFLPALVVNIGRVLGMVVLHGDENWRQNLSGAPVFDPLNGLLFFIGLAVALRLRRPASTFVLLSALILLMPSMLSIDAPHYLRTIAAAPALYAIWALGVVETAHVLAKHFPSLVARVGFENRALTASVVGTLVVMVALTVSIARNGWDYFGIYAKSPQVAGAFNDDLATAGRFLASSPTWQTNRQNVYVTDRYRLDRASLVYFLYPKLTPSEQANWLSPGNAGVFFPQEKAVPLPTAPSLYIVGGNGQTVIKSLGPSVQRAEALADGGRHLGLAIWARPVSERTFGTPVNVEFGPWLTLESAEVLPTTVALRWRIDRIPPYQPSVFVHVEDSAHHTLAISDQVVGFSTASWHVGQEFISWHPLALPPGLAPGSYTVTTGVYNKKTGTRETATHQGQPLPSVLVGRLNVRKPVPGNVLVDHSIDHSLAPGLTIVGYRLPVQSVDAGGSVPITLVWRSTANTRPDYQVVLAVIGSKGTELGRWSGPVGGTSYPTSRWPTDTTIFQVIDVPVVATAQGPTTLKLMLKNSSGANVGSTSTIASVNVKASNHQFTPPHPRQGLHVQFGNVGMLVGVDMPTRTFRPGETVPITLYWKADGSNGIPYTEFGHVLDANNHIVGQRDEQPVHGTRPTTSWVRGEYITDPHEIPINPGTPPGTYRVEVGLYDSRSGQRVTTGTPDNRVIIGSIRVGP